MENGRNYTRSGGIAGSWQQLDKGVTNLVGSGMPMADVIHSASLTPAKYLGIDDQLGSIVPGKRACLAAWDESARICWGLDGTHIEYAR